MTACYLSDIANWAAELNANIPLHVPFLENSKHNFPHAKLRLAQWNINVLHGADFKSPLSGKMAAETVHSFQADIVLIQEGGVQAFEGNVISPYSYLFEGLDSSDRITEFHECLKALGYTLIFADGVPNPAMLATRLHIVDVLDIFSIDKGGSRCHSYYDKMVSEKETRNGRYVKIRIGEDGVDGRPAPIIAVCITHLHHNENEMRGLRLGEIRTVLDNRPSSGSSATIISTDFNQTRKRDFHPREWAVITAGLDIVDQPHDDGVADELEANGFICTYDHMPSRPDQMKPVFTHWTSTIVDYTYVHFERPQAWSVDGVYVVPCSLSDHMPVIHDLSVDLSLL